MRVEQLEEMYHLEDHYWWFVARRRLVRRLVGRYAGAAQSRILDIGCGTGGTLSALQGLGELWGCDISADALEMCRGRGLINLVQCPAEALKFGDNSLDVTLSCDVLEHVRDDAAALREMRRVLRPNGYAIFTVPAHQWLWSDHDEALEHLRRYSRSDFAGRLATAGFRVCKLTYAVSLLFPPLVTFRGLQRLRVTRRRPKTGLIQLPGWLNSLFIRLLDIESAIILRAGMPQGASLVCVAQPLKNAEKL